MTEQCQHSLQAMLLNCVLYPVQLYVHVNLLNLQNKRQITLYLLDIALAKVDM